MNWKSARAPARLLVLMTCTIFLAVDAWAQYHPQLYRVPTSTPVLVSPAPTIVPSPISSANQAVRVTAFTLLRTVSQTQISAAQTSFVGTALQSPVSQVAIYQLQYQIHGKNDEWQPIIAKVYIPTQFGKYPLFVFGAGTTGMADKCAPSLENMAVENIGNYENQMIAQAAEGYTAVLPDYEGFHSQATQAYFIAASESKVLLGAITSLHELQPTTPSLQFADLNKVFLSGYSQGGHAALSAAADWAQLPSSVELEGIVQYAGAADVQALFIDSPWLASYLVDSFGQYYGSSLDQQLVLQDRWLISLAQNDQELCVNAAYKFYPHSPSKMYNPSFLDAIETNTWPTNLATWQKILTENTPTNLPDVPYLSLQGKADPIVTPHTQQANAAKLCEQGKHLEYREYADTTHFQIRQVSFIDSNAWMRSVLAGQTPPASCQ